MLESCASGVSDLVKRQIAKNNGKQLPSRYSPALKSFALTLNFYSPSAYKFVRKTFNTCLQHPRTLEKWYSKVDVKPGWTEASLTALKHTNESQNSDNVYSLIMDEMAIRQHVE